MQKIWDKLTEGLQNYCFCNNFSDVCLGLSGGLDSAVCAVLAADAFGGSHVHALMMKTDYTSELSLKIARRIAELNNLDYREIDIQPLIDSQQAFLLGVFGEMPKSAVLENIQARERGKTLMALSNQFNHLVLACGNKSETATGYCTLYGDTCGGLAPIGNLYKSEIFRLARWRNSIGEALPEDVINRAPSAELARGQKDEDNLPPYAILDAVLRLYIDEGKNTEEIVAAGFERQTTEWIIRRYHTQAFKRCQLPPALPVV